MAIPPQPPEGKLRGRPPNQVPELSTNPMRAVVQGRIAHLVHNTHNYMQAQTAKL